MSVKFLAQGINDLTLRLLDKGNASRMTYDQQGIPENLLKN
jgi:hypothetical protein